MQAGYGTEDHQSQVMTANSPRGSIAISPRVSVTSPAIPANVAASFGSFSGQHRLSLSPRVSNAQMSTTCPAELLLPAGSPLNSTPVGSDRHSSDMGLGFRFPNVLGDDEEEEHEPGDLRVLAAQLKAERMAREALQELLPFANQPGLSSEDGMGTMVAPELSNAAPGMGRALALQSVISQKQSFKATQSDPATPKSTKAARKKLTAQDLLKIQSTLRGGQANNSHGNSHGKHEQQLAMSTSVPLSGQTGGQMKSGGSSAGPASRTHSLKQILDLAHADPEPSTRGPASMSMLKSLTMRMSRVLAQDVAAELSQDDNDDEMSDAGDSPGRHQQASRSVDGAFEFSPVASPSGKAAARTAWLAEAAPGASSSNAQGSKPVSRKGSFTAMATVVVPAPEPMWQRRNQVDPSPVAAVDDPQAATPEHEDKQAAKRLLTQLKRSNSKKF